MMKRFCAIAIAMLLLATFTACGGVRTVNFETDVPSGELTVYYFINGASMPYYKDVLAGFQNAYPDLTVTGVAFTDSAALAEQLQADRESDAMPDVLFFSGYSGLNWYDLIDDGTLMELTPMFEGDASYDGDLLLDGIAEGCQYKNKQYIAPFTVSLPFFLSSTERVHTYCPALESAVTTEERLDAVLDFLGTEREETPYALAMSPGDFDLLNWGDALGLPFADFENRSVSGGADPAWTQRVYDLPYRINANSAAAWSDPRFQSLGTTDAFSKSVLQDNCVLLYFPIFLTVDDIRLAGAAYQTLEETMTLVSFPQPEDSLTYGATIVSGGGITAASDNPTGGYFFLRYMMAHGQELGYGLPVGREVLSTLDGIDQPWATQLRTMLSSLSGVRMYTPAGVQWDVLSTMNDWSYKPGGENFEQAWEQAASVMEKGLFAAAQ